jgi:hypothetical protein
MRPTILSALIMGLLSTGTALAASPLSISKVWGYDHASTGVLGQTSEIVSFDSASNALWVVGLKGVDVLDASNGSLIQHIDTSMYGSANSVSIFNGIAAIAIEDSVDRTSNGTVKLFDTTTRALASGINSISVGALPDMVAFSKDGSRLLVANEATPTNYAGFDPAGSVSIIDMNTRSVIATAGLAGVSTSGSAIRTDTGMDYEPEYIAINAAGTKAYVTLQEANAIGVLDMNSNSFSQIIGLGTKDFSAAGYEIDPSHKDGKIELRPASVSGFYQPDSIAVYEKSGKTYLVMANEGDTREDDGDKARVKDTSLKNSSPSDLQQLNISTTDSSEGELLTFGGRSFTIRDENGDIVFDSGNELDAKAIELGIYDDNRSDDKGVEPEGVALLEIGGRTLAFIGLERTTQSAIAIYDITDPANATFLDMIVDAGDLSPEGLQTFMMDGAYYLAVANEVSGTTSLYRVAAVPEPETWAMLLAGLGLVGFMGQRRKSA